MKTHFIGIGGIGISALARHFLCHNTEVTGSDLIENETIKALKSMGAKIYKGHKDSLPKGVERVIYSPAISNDNSEILAAERLNLEILSYPEALGELTKKYFTIAVSGTHGKSTTTGMIAVTIQDLDPTIIVGTKMHEFGESNYRMGQSNYLVIEADEWQGSLLNYHPNCIVLTNLEAEHLDFYRDLNHLIKTFQKYLGNLKNGGKVIYNGEDSNLKKLHITNGCPFSKSDAIATKIKNILVLPGDYNLENALAAMKVSKILGVKQKKALHALSKFKGSWRRFEEKTVKIKGQNHKLILDYAHHPTELKAVLTAVSQKFSRPICVIFQPHQYQRTLYLKKKFIEVLNQSTVDNFFITDIYSVPGREEDWIKKSITAENLVSEVKNKNVHYLPGNFNKIAKQIRSNLQTNEIIVIIGAGDIYRLEESLQRSKKNN